MKEVDYDAVEELRTQNPERLMGISPESIYLTLYAVANDTAFVEELSPVFRAQTLDANLSFSYQTASTVNQGLCVEFGLVKNGELSDLGRLILASENPTTNIQIAAAWRLSRLRTYLLEFVDLDGDVVDRSDLESLAKDNRDQKATIPLLHSLGFAEVIPQGAIPDLAACKKATTEQGPESPSSQITVYLLRALSTINENEAEHVAAEMLNTSVSSVENMEETLVIQSLAQEEPRHTPLTECEDGLMARLEKLREEESELTTALSEAADGQVSVRGDAISYEQLIRLVRQETADGRLSPEDIATLLHTVSETESFGYLPLRFLQNVFDADPYEIYRLLSTIDCVSCSMEQSALRISSMPPVTRAENTNTSKRLVETLTSQLSAIRGSISELESLSFKQRSPLYEKIVSSVFRSVDEDAVAPTYFAYTLPDPEELGEEVMEKYVDDSEGLMKERAKLNRWKREEKPDDARRYTELTDRIISRGLSHELESQILRIMTPYDDNTFSEFASQFRSLIRDGYEIRLLTRHTRQRWQWKRLRDNLLGELTTNRENVSIRTYSRYKQYQKITPSTDEKELSEFGIHAKLQTIGNPEEGATLLGSANLMENSYHWNPECGAYSEKSNFVSAAISFFDHVWELAASDVIDLENLQRIPERSFHPSLYTK
jgi:hypothetical protein